MIVHIDSWLAKLWLKLPRSIGAIHFVRIGNRYSDNVCLTLFRRHHV
jgi:hypothetical protein